MKLNIDTYFAPLLVRRDATNIHKVIFSIEKNIKGKGIAKSGIETALLDTYGKRLDVSIGTLLGDVITESLPRFMDLGQREYTTRC